MNNDTNNNLNGVNNETPTNLNNFESQVLDGYQSQVMDNVVQPTPVSNPTPVQDPNSMLSNPTPVVDNTQPSNIGVSPVPVENMNMGNVNQVETPQAYTNPNTINTNPNPMPGFENSGVIGTTPPISLEQEKQPKKKNNMTVFILLIVLVLLGIGGGVWYVLNNTDLLKKPAPISISTKNVEINVGDDIPSDVSAYADIVGTDSNNCSVDRNNIDRNHEGNYNFTVKCGEISKTGTITVVDNRELQVTTKTVVKTKGEEISVNDFIVAPDDNITYEFTDANAVNSIMTGTSGSYVVKITATDGKKTTEVNANLILFDKKLKGYLNCSSNSQTILDGAASMTVVDKFAIIDTTDFAFGNVAIEEHVFKYTDEASYADLISKYNTDGSVTINGITGNTSFDNTASTVTIENYLSSETLNSKYGANVLKNYSSINSYFKDTLGYNCTYERSND